MSSVRRRERPGFESASFFPSYFSSIFSSRRYLAFLGTYHLIISIAESLHAGSTSVKLCCSGQTIIKRYLHQHDSRVPGSLPLQTYDADKRSPGQYTTGGVQKNVMISDVATHLWSRGHKQVGTSVASPSRRNALRRYFRQCCPCAANTGSIFSERYLSMQQSMRSSPVVLEYMPESGRKQRYTCSRCRCGGDLTIDLLCATLPLISVSFVLHRIREIQLPLTFFSRIIFFADIFAACCSVRSFSACRARRSLMAVDFLMVSLSKACKDIMMYHDEPHITRDRPRGSERRAVLV